MSKLLSVFLSVVVLLVLASAPVIAQSSVTEEILPLVSSGSITYVGSALSFPSRADTVVLKVTTGASKVYMSGAFDSSGVYVQLQSRATRIASSGTNQRSFNARLGMTSGIVTVSRSPSGITNEGTTNYYGLAVSGNGVGVLPSPNKMALAASTTYIIRLGNAYTTNQTGRVLLTFWPVVR